MANATLIAYIATAAAVLGSVTALVQLLIGAMFGRVLGVFPSALAGSFLAWGIIDFLWVTYEGRHVPIAALAGAIVFVLLRGLWRGDLKDGKTLWTVSAETAAILILGGYIVLSFSPVRWY